MPATALAWSSRWEEREREFARRWNVTGGIGYIYAFPDVTTNDEINRHASDFVRGRIASIVRDPAKAAILTPQDYGIGGKRICVDTNYYETFNRDNVTLVSIRNDPIVRMTARGLRTLSSEHALDFLVLAIGFDAMTGALLRVNITGRGGAGSRIIGKTGPEPISGFRSQAFQTCLRSPRREALPSSPTWSRRSNSMSTGSRTASRP